MRLAPRRKDLEETQAGGTEVEGHNSARLIPCARTLECLGSMWRKETVLLVLGWDAKHAKALRNKFGVAEPQSRLTSLAFLAEVLPSLTPLLSGGPDSVPARGGLRLFGSS